MNILATYRATTFCVALCVAAGLIGCKADAAKDTGYTNSSLMQRDASLPFNKVWIKPGLDPSKYAKVYVAPVDTEYMLKNTGWQKGMKKEQVEADVALIANYAQDAIKKSFRDDPKHRLLVVESPTGDPDTLLLEMAITEIVPSKVALNAMGYIPFGVGLSITAVRAVAKDTSSVAMEVRVRDAATKEIVGMAADRESEQVAVVSVRGLTWYSHAEATLSQWAHQFVQVANRKPGEKIKDTDVFTLQPW